MSLADLESTAARVLGAQPIITCDHHNGQAYLDSVRTPDDMYIACRTQLR